MNGEAINTENQYQKAVSRTMAIFHAEEDSSEFEELTTLLALIKEYELEHITLPI
jgi:HTH-type transcriptional regulator/antitoxin HigA